jgi:hypothetical protein
VQTSPSRPRPRPYRATVYLPGHDETGHGVVVAKVSAATQAGLERVLAPWRSHGYQVRAYEVMTLDLGLDDEDSPDTLD